MSNLWGREPAAVVAFVQAVVVLCISFGLDLTVEQQGSILAVVALGLGLLTRSRVEPKG